jgi:hypothetical protein
MLGVTAKTSEGAFPPAEHLRVTIGKGKHARPAWRMPAKMLQYVLNSNGWRLALGARDNFNF